MCIMAIHAKSESANAVQAMAHNIDTVCRDLSQLADLLAARHDRDSYEIVMSTKRDVEQQARRVWNLWRRHVGPDAVPKGGLTSTGWEHDRRMDLVMRGGPTPADTVGEEAE